MSNKLLEKITACLYGGAIGDAMGGPVEMWEPSRIEKLYGYVDTLLDYDYVEPNPHGPWGKSCGTYTDDTRLVIIALDAFIGKQRIISRGDFKQYLIKSFYENMQPLNKDFLEEYMYKAIYEDEKEAFGGRPTNGGVMAAPAIGCMCALRPQLAYETAFDSLFMSTGYGRAASAICSSAISSAFIPNIIISDIKDIALKCASTSKEQVEGKLWHDVSLYKFVGTKVEDMIASAYEIGIKYSGDFISFRDNIVSAVKQDFQANGAETAALAMGCLAYSGGDFIKGVSAAVNIGRDNDSTAGIVGSILGALNGSVPADMVNQINSANPINIGEKAKAACTVIAGQIDEAREYIKNIDRL